MAFDSRITADGIFVGSMTKGIKTNKYIAAACGTAEDIQAFLDWIADGADLANKKSFGLDRECDINAIVVNKKGEIFSYESRLYPFKIDGDYFSIGSGSSFALGAMAFGASASQSIRIASKFDSCTGGSIKELKFSDKKKPTRTRQS